MTNPVSPGDPAFFRIQKVLDYVHQNIDKPLTIDSIAEQSCWSRWQLQRVFQSQVGKNVAGYVRELKLSKAAEAILDGDERLIDIATRLGFSSEISFSRSFKQHFNQSPRGYRNEGKRRGLTLPIQAPKAIHRQVSHRRRFVEVRVETQAALELRGIKTAIQGVFSSKPNFSSRVPALWHRFYQQFSGLARSSSQLVGVVDLSGAAKVNDDLTYWATVLEEDARKNQSVSSEPLSALHLPRQTYAVIRHVGPITELPETLLWFLLIWLPESDYRGVEGFELEKYPGNYDMRSHASAMEYWLPVNRV